MAEININNALSKAELQDKFQESIRDLLSMKITLPLGNPAFKYVHTNQFMWIDLPTEFLLENFKIIAKYMNNTNNRYSGYEADRWYIEGLTINNDGNKFTVDLDLNPFPSSNKKFRDNKVAYQDAYLKANDNKSNASTSTASVKGNTTLKGGQGSTIDNLVKNIVGQETDDLKKCKLIHEWLRKEVRYSRYCCAKYKTAEQCYNNRKHLNCADTATLTCAMMLSAGLNAYIVHRTYNGGHFWTIIEINGKKYASDQTGDGSAFNTVWKASGRTSVSNGGDYSRKNGSFPDCYPSYSC